MPGVSVRILSIAVLALLHMGARLAVGADGVSGTGQWGVRLDLDADGHADVISITPDAGRVRILAFDHSVVLREFAGSHAGDLFGQQVVAVADISGDGLPDLLVAAPGHDEAGGGRGALHAFDLTNAALMWSYVEEEVGVLATTGFAVVSDQNEDAKPEVVVPRRVGAANAPSRLLSGVTGEALLDINCETATIASRAAAGHRLYLVTDLNNSGIVDQGDVALYPALAQAGSPKVDFDKSGTITSDDGLRIADDAIALRATAVSDPNFCSSAFNAVGDVIPTFPFGSTCECPCEDSTGQPGDEGCVVLECPSEVQPCNDGGTWPGVWMKLDFSCFIEEIDDLAGFCLHSEEPNAAFAIRGPAQTSWGSPGPCGSGPIMMRYNDRHVFVYVELHAACPQGGTVPFTVTVRRKSPLGPPAPDECVTKECVVTFHTCSPVGGAIRDMDTGLLSTEEEPVPMVQDAVGTLEFTPNEGVATGGRLEWSLAQGDEGKVSLFGATGQRITYRVNPAFGTDFSIRIRAKYFPPGCPPFTRTYFMVLEGDSDGDGLADTREVQLAASTYPCLSVNDDDSDDDGIPDGTELVLGTDPCNPLSHPSPMGDRDRDGLSDIEEVRFTKTNWRAFDSDGDGAQDYGEVYLRRFQSALGFDPMDPHSVALHIPIPGVFFVDGHTTQYRVYDQDRDFLFDPFEEMIGLDPLEVDSNRNGLPDGVELIAGLGNGTVFGNPWNGVGGGGDQEIDSDGDGLSDFVESVLGTDLHNADSDNDGLPDGFEVRLGYDPLNPDTNGDGVGDAFEDPDGDGLDNYLEDVYGTRPYVPDSDGDGVSDGQEVAHGGLPTDPTDGGQPLPEDEKCLVTITVGDGSNSHSEKWALKVGSITHRARNYGEVFPGTYVFRRGQSYEFSLQHRGTKPGFGVCDPDYTARIEAGCMSIIIDDPNGPILFENFNSNQGDPCNPRAGMVGKLYLPVIRMYDLRKWGPTNAGGQLGLATTDPFASRTTQERLTGVLADGSTATVLRLEVDNQPLPEEVRSQVALQGWRAELNESMTSVAGGFPLGCRGGLWPMSGSNLSVPPLPLNNESAGQAGYVSGHGFELGVAMYVPPEHWHTSSCGTIPVSNEYQLLHVNVIKPSSSAVLGTFSFRLYRPPVVLVHGIWVSPPPSDTWGDPRDPNAAWSESGRTPIPTRYYYVDYATTSMKGFSENADSVGNSIVVALSEYAHGVDHAGPGTKGLVQVEPGTWTQSTNYVQLSGQRIAGTRCDVIGHSMGGQVARWHLADTNALVPPGTSGRARGTLSSGWGVPAYNINLNSPIIRTSTNWWLGDIVHLVTIGSPFKGSYWADWLEPHVEPRDLGWWMDPANRAFLRAIPNINALYGPGGAANGTFVPPTGVADLATTSEAYLVLSDTQTTYPPHVNWLPVMCEASPGRHVSGATWTVIELLDESSIVDDDIDDDGGDIFDLFAITESQLSNMRGLTSSNSDFIVHKVSQSNGDLGGAVLVQHAPHFEWFFPLRALPDSIVLPVAETKSATVSIQVGRILNGASSKPWKAGDSLK